MTYNIEEVIKGVDGKLFGNRNNKIEFLLTDSRALTFAEETLFFAIETERNDGHNYINDLYKNGVKCFVVSKLPNKYDIDYPNCSFVLVDNTLQALQKLSTYHRHKFDTNVVGITGSNGKTIVKEWLYQLFLSTKKVIRSPRSYNSQIGVPLSVWLVKENTELALFEAGISKCNEMEKLQPIIVPNIGIFTNIADAHQENFKSIEEKIEEKFKLFKGVKTLIYCLDNEQITKCANTKSNDCRLVTWSFKNKNATLYIEEVQKQDNNTTIHYIYKGGSYKFKIPFSDSASIYNAACCAVSALELGCSTIDLEQRMPLLEQVAMRLEVKDGSNGCTLINDSYNSDLNSLQIALNFTKRRTTKKKSGLTVILSDIYQSGMQQRELYENVSALLEQQEINRFIGIGNEISAQKDIIKIKNKTFFSTTSQLLESGLLEHFNNEIILIKGARKFNFELIAEQLAEKVHETILEVNLNALTDNLNFYRSFLNKTTKLVCMVKADAYGAGAIQVAKTLQDQGVEYLAVAVADEGATLRKHGIHTNIMVMNPEMSAFKTLFYNKLEPEVYSFRMLNALIKAARKEGITNYPVHIKFDTGMHRLGFNPISDVEELINTFKKQNALIPRSVFTHFAGSDSEEFNDFSTQQFQIFTTAAQKFQNAFQHKILFHINNSAGIERFPERQLDMCRLGIGLYGFSGKDQRVLKNVSSLKTTILQIHTVPQKDTVGYGRKGTLNKESLIAAIPIGYADGLNRKLGNRTAYCLVNGKKAQYVGNICMDVTMIDVTNIDCKEGDCVEIFGDNLPATILSNAIDTISYEILTSVSNRVKRVYFQY